MNRLVKIRIMGSGGETDAPTVDDLSAQLRDYFDLLKLVEQSLADDGQIAIVWRVVRAETNSPITFTVEAFARQFAVNVDNRANFVVNHALAGLQDLQTKSGRPPHFSDQALDVAEKLFERVTNGLQQTEIYLDDVQAALDITPTKARVAVQNVRELLQPSARPFKELGSVEGYFQSAGQDGFGRRLLHLRSRLNGDDIKCLVSGEAEKQLSHCEIGDLWRRRRLEVIGLVHYRGPGRISHIEAHRLRFFRASVELPSTDDILDKDFTGGLSSEDYLEKLRDGRLA